MNRTPKRSAKHKTLIPETEEWHNRIPKITEFVPIPEKKIRQQSIFQGHLY